MSSATSWIDSVYHFNPRIDTKLRDPDGTKLSVSLMQTLDAMRERVGRPFHVTSGYRSLDLQAELVKSGKTSALKSAHVTGEAVDGYFSNYGLLETFIEALRSPFTGIGCYPTSNPPVIHVDIRDRGTARQLWIVTQDSQYIYAPDTRFFTLLRQLCSV